MPDITPTPSTPSPAPQGVPNAAPPAVAATAPSADVPPVQQAVPPAAPASAQPAQTADPVTTPTDPGTSAAPAEPVGDWPADWREKYANGDEKLLKRLGRYGSPKAALDALFHAQSRISSGELKSALKPDATPEEKAIWRAENGIPESPDKYDTTLKDGMVLGEADKAVVDKFLKVAHDRNMRQEDVSEVLSWWAGEQEQAAQAQRARDAESRMLNEDTLRNEYGPEYRRNLKIAHDVLMSAPEGVQDLMLARMPDGTPVGNSPEVIRWLVQLGRELNPVSTVVPGSGTNAMQTVETELNSLKKLMGDHKSEYWRGPNAAKMQDRYRQLVGAVSAQKGR